MLEFPTMAERVIEQFETSGRTISFNTICEAMGAKRDDEGCTIIWRFDDDTSLRISGRGANHRYEAQLP